MKTRTDQRPAPAEETTLIVVDVFQSCLCHLVITARLRYRPYWMLFRVPSLCDVNFGDTLTLITDHNMMPPEVRLYLDRGPLLRFHLQEDDIPAPILEKLISELPIIDQPPQGEMR